MFATDILRVKAAAISYHTPYIRVTVEIAQRHTTRRGA